MRKIISEITLETSNNRKDCLEMSLFDLVQYYEDLIKLSEAKAKAYENALKG